MEMPEWKRKPINALSAGKKPSTANSLTGGILYQIHEDLTGWAMSAKIVKWGLMCREKMPYFSPAIYHGLREDHLTCWVAVHNF